MILITGLEEIAEKARDSDDMLPLGINDMPPEIFIEIFKFLSKRESVMKFPSVCLHWRHNIARHIMAPEINRKAEGNHYYEKLLEKHGWTGNCDETEMIIRIYHMINPITSELLY